MINWRIAGNPFNWVTVLVVMTMAGFIYQLWETQYAATAE